MPSTNFSIWRCAYDDGAPPSLTRFLAKLRASEPEVKRDMDHGRDEVRVMTVHGAKGLEAPIVFLPDTCTTASGGNAAARHRQALAPRASGRIAGAGRLDSQRHDADRGRPNGAPRQGRARTEERNRLLYVAMTRARDRLYIAGFEGKSGRADGCWYDVIFDALKPQPRPKSTSATDAIGWRNETPQTAEPEKSRKEKSRQPIATSARRSQCVALSPSRSFRCRWRPRGSNLMRPTRKASR